MKHKRATQDESLLIALDIMEKVTTASNAPIPSVAAMAREMKVDIHKISHALHLLREYGYLQFSRGRGIRPGPKLLEDIREAPRRTRTDIAGTPLYELLKSQICKGELKIGETLPKRSYYAVERNISRETVGKVYARLTDEKVVCKKGRRWYVGRPPSAHSDAGEKLPFILLIQPLPRYRRRYNTERNWKFMYTFTEEATRAGIRLQPYTARIDTMDPTVPSGTDKLLSYIRKSESPYLGALVLGRTDEYDDFFGLIQMMLAQNSPVVWFNYSEGPNPLRMRHSRFYICTISEEAFSGEAIRFLSRFGHRKVGYTSYHLGLGWQTRRLEILRERGRNCTPQMEVVSFFDTYDRLFSCGRPAIAARIERLRTSGPHTVQTVLSSAFEIVRKKKGEDLSDHCCSQALTDYMFDWPLVISEVDVAQFPLLPRELLAFFIYDEFSTQKPPTAIIFPSDRTAVTTYSHLIRLGLDTPADISVISYDNYLDATVLPVTTIDLGTDNLGYRAFHAILQDIPVVSKSDGNIITADPRVDRRGTVGFQ